MSDSRAEGSSRKKEHLAVLDQLKAAVEVKPASERNDAHKVYLGVLGEMVTSMEAQTGAEGDTEPGSDKRSEEQRRRKEERAEMWPEPRSGEMRNLREEVRGSGMIWRSGSNAAEQPNVYLRQMHEGFVHNPSPPSQPAAPLPLS